MTTTALKRLSVEEYLAFERTSDTKHEFYDGEIFAMSGGTASHSLVAVNLSTLLNVVLTDRACRVFNSDMRVVCPTGLRTYPDITVVCGSPQFEDERPDTLTNPLVIVEVLSPSTEAYDRGRKFGHYKTVPTLREYVLVAQDRAAVDHFARQGDGDQWLLTSSTELDQKLWLPALDCSVPLEKIYAKVEFPPDDEPTSR